MKRGKSFAKQLLLISSMFFFTVLVITACSKDNKNNNTNQAFAISGSASGSQVVPAVADTGTASITGTYSSSTRLLTYTTTWTNLTGGPNAGAFYSGAAGTNGTIVGDAWVLGTGLTGTGTFSGSTTLAADQAAQLTSGNFYYTLSTVANPNGEVRGQVTATPQ